MLELIVSIQREEFRFAGMTADWMPQGRTAMKTRAVVCVCGLLVGCASPVSSDPFTGTYRFVDPADRGIYIIKQVGQGKWTSTSAKTPGEPAQPWDEFESLPMVQAPASEVARWFRNGSPLAQTTCLAEVRNDGRERYLTPFLCRLPSGVPYEIADAMTPGRMISSHTGYVLVVGTPAGVITPDLVRTD